MITCGGCYHYKSSRGQCKNKRASTYNAYYDPDSYGCQMRIPRILLPFGSGLKYLVLIILLPLQIISLFNGGDPTMPTKSDDSGFDF